MLTALNPFFFAFHTAWLAFNGVGWAWRATRRIHLLTITLTALSWFVLGIWHGWGYCVCTDWHWRVREQLGYESPPSYMQLLVLKLTGLEVPAAWADAVTLVLFAIVTVLTLVLNLRDWRRRSRAAESV